MPPDGRRRWTRRSGFCASTPEPERCRSGCEAECQAESIPSLLTATARPGAARSAPTRPLRPGCAARPADRPRRRLPPARRRAWRHAARHRARAGRAAAWRNDRHQDHSIASTLRAYSAAPSLPASSASSASSSMTIRAAVWAQADWASAAPGLPVRDRMDAARCRRSGRGSIMAVVPRSGARLPAAAVRPSRLGGCLGHVFAPLRLAVVAVA